MKLTNADKHAIRDLASIAETYANIYEPRFRTIANNAFLDGMTFAALVKYENITPEQITEEICRRVRETSEKVVKEAQHGKYN